uniref:RING-type domain-containing protein n=1 Tax=Arundo donax TaxID=35708 RepID=A0A0A9DAC8_ARUDO
MDATGVPPAASDEQRDRTLHRVVIGDWVVVGYRVLVDGRAYIVEETRSDPPPDEDEELRDFLWGPMVAVRRNHFFRIAAAVGRWEEQREAEEAYHNHKRARVPASSKVILGLQEVRAGDARMQAECAVCLKDFDTEDKLTAMPCSHAFHQECIFGWLRVNQSALSAATHCPQRRRSSACRCQRPRAKFCCVPIYLN